MMRLRNYTIAEIYDASDEELAEMHANNLRAIQLLDFVIVVGGAFCVLAVLDILHL